jgi:hypothetical protein
MTRRQAGPKASAEPTRAPSPAERKLAEAIAAQYLPRIIRAAQQRQAATELQDANKQSS